MLLEGVDGVVILSEVHMTLGLSSDRRYYRAHLMVAGATDECMECRNGRRCYWTNVHVFNFLVFVLTASGGHAGHAPADTMGGNCSGGSI